MKLKFCFLFLLVVSFATSARPDAAQVLSVNVLQTPLYFLPGESTSLSFDWVPSTNTIFNVKLLVNGPFSGYSATPTYIAFLQPDDFYPSGGIGLMNFNNADNYQIQYDFNDNGLGAVQPAVGEYYSGSGVDLFAVPVPGGNGEISTFFGTTDVFVTNSSDPIPAAEPTSTLLLLFAVPFLMKYWNWNASLQHSGRPRRRWPAGRPQ